SVNPSSAPPPEFYTGDLRNWVDATGKQYQVYDPGTTTLVNGSYVRQPFANNQIPTTRIDPISQSILTYVKPLLAPNVPGIVPGTSGWVRQNFLGSGSTRSPDDKHSIKVDQ